MKKLRLQQLNDKECLLYLNFYADSLNETFFFISLKIVINNTRNKLLN